MQALRPLAYVALVAPLVALVVAVYVTLAPMLA